MLFPLDEVTRYLTGIFLRLEREGALLAGARAAEGVWASKVSIFATDQSAAERLYAPLLSGQASIMGWHSQCLTQGIYKVDAAGSPLANADEVPPIDQSEFEAAKAADDQLGLKGTVQAGSYGVHFPRQGGASALWVRTTERHSLYGNGVLATLELPIPLDRKGLPELTDQLNRWELSGPDLPPRLGAWARAH